MDVSCRLQIATFEPNRASSLVGHPSFERKCAIKQLYSSEFSLPKHSISCSSVSTGKRALSVNFRNKCDSSPTNASIGGSRFSKLLRLLVVIHATALGAACNSCDYLQNFREQFRDSL